MKDRVQQMIAAIESEVKYTSAFTGRDKLNPSVINAMTCVPRDKFVPYYLKFEAFDNCPLPIGHDQTISQPYIVALMTDLLQLEQTHTVLEIGTGSGYQSAVLSMLCQKVYTVELIAELSNAAIINLEKLGYNNIEARNGNGYDGWPEHAPYDGIIVTAAATHIPPALIEQLKPGGRLVIPVGRPYGNQELILVEKDVQGEVLTNNILGVVFVPLKEDILTKKDH